MYGITVSMAMVTAVIRVSYSCVLRRSVHSKPASDQKAVFKKCDFTIVKVAGFNL